MTIAPSEPDAGTHPDPHAPRPGIRASAASPGIPDAFADTVITDDLRGRSPRAPDFAAENRALAALAEAMASDPDGVLQLCTDLATRLCRAGSAGISILETDDSQQLFRWHAISGAFADHAAETIPRAGSPCDLVISTGRVQLLRDAHRFLPDPDIAGLHFHETLLVPWQVNGEAVGALWAIKHQPGDLFDAEDARLLTSLARFASAGHRMNLALRGTQHARQQLEQRADELRLARERVEAIELRFRRVIGIETVGFLAFRLDGTVTDANATFERMSGYSRDALRRIDWKVLTAPEFLDATDSAARELAGRGRTAPYEKELIRPDGSRWWGLFAPTRVGGGGPDAECIEFVIDITESKQTGSALRESEARFRHMADSAPALIWMTDAEGRVVFANMHYDHVFGRPAADMLGNGWESVVVPEDLPVLNAIGLAAFQRRQTFRVEVRVRDKTGAVRWMRCEGVPRLNDRGDFLGYTGCAVDITEARLTAEELEQRVAERSAELKAAEEMLRQSQKMEAIGQLTGGIAHDFNNMLQGVTGGLRTARRRMAQDRLPEAERFLDLADESAERAAALTRRLLAFARRQPLEPKPVSPNELIASMTELIRRTMGSHVTIDLRLRDDVGFVLCDANELESALLNLAINARDAMDGGGQLTLATESVMLAAADIAGYEALSPGEYIRIAVSDTGEGIPEALVDRVFEPFFTTKPQDRGTGLGLSQVYSFVRQSGGRVRLHSQPGQGTTVHLLLPRHKLVQGALAAAASATAEASGGGATVLLVDDEAGARMPVAERLRELGYRVLEAADGPTALEVLAWSYRPDLLITDVGLPEGMDGAQLAAAVRERLPGLPVLFITGYTGTRLPPGAEVIGKPFELDFLARRAQAALAGREGGGETPAVGLPPLSA